MAKPSNRDLAADWGAFRDHGDTDALARVFDHAAPRLMLVAVHLTRDSETAEDLLQTTFLSAMKSAQAYQGRAPVMAWLTRILCNRATDLFRAERRARRLRDSEVDVEPTASATPADLVVEQETIERVAAAIDSMQSTYRQILTLRLVHGLRTIEIARSLGRSPDSVRSQMSRAMKLLKAKLPQSIAVPGMAVALSSECLAGVRTRVLAAAGATATVASSARLKLLVWPAILVVAALVYWQLDKIVFDPAESDGSSATLADAEPSTTAPEVSRSPVPDPETPTPQPAEPPARWRVVYTDDSPAWGITVTAFPFNTTPRVHVPSPLITDENGYVDTTALPAGRYWFQRGMGENILAEVGRSAVLRLQRGFGVRGRVVDQAGKGVASADVWLSFGSDGDSGRVVTKSDADGWFEIRDASNRLALMAKAPGYAWSARYEILRTSLASGGVRLRLSSTARRLHGVVQDELGSLLANADVLALPMQDEMTLASPDGPRTKLPAYSVTQTNSIGEYELPNLGRGLFLLEVQKSGSGLGSMQKLIRVEQPETRQDVTLRQGWTLRGVLRDDVGAPLPGLLVQVERGRFSSYWDRTDSAGKFELQGLPPGEVSVIARVPNKGHAAASIPGESGDAKSCELIPAAGRWIRGRLVDESGRPLASWPVTVFPIDLRLRAPGRVFTDDEGRFFATNLAETQWFSLRCAPRLYSPSHLIRKVELGELGDLVVRVDHRPTARVIGQILTTKGTPPKGARVTLVSQVDQGNTSIGYVDEGTGRFEFRDCEIGTFDVRLEAPPRPAVILTTVELSPDEVEDLGTRQIDDVSTFVLHLPEEADANWQAVVVNSTTRAMEPRRVVNGRLEVAVGKAGVTIMAQSKTWVQQTFRFRPPELGKTFHARAKFSKGTRVHLDFSFSSSFVPHSVGIQVADATGQSRFAWTIASWVHDFEFQCPPGKYTLMARTSDGKVETMPLVVGAEPVRIQVAF